MVGELNGHEPDLQLQGVGFSPDGRHIASGSGDGTAIIWDMNNGDLLRQLDGHEGLVYHVRFAKDGQSLLSAAEDGQAITWNLALNLEELLAWVESNRYIPDFTCSQRAQYQIEPLCTEE